MSLPYLLIYLSTYLPYLPYLTLTLPYLTLTLPTLPTLPTPPHPTQASTPKAPQRRRNCGFWSTTSLDPIYIYIKTYDVIDTGQCNCICICIPHLIFFLERKSFLRPLDFRGSPFKEMGIDPYSVPPEVGWGF